MAFDPVSAALELGSKLVDHFFPNAQEAAAAKLELLKMQQTGVLAELTADTQLAQAQADINKTEAQSESIFVAGWRPGIGWVCAASFGYNYLLGPLLEQLFKLPMATLDLGTMMPVLVGMLGLGTMRSFDKATASNNAAKVAQS